jgi:hypothetical protein
VALEIKSGGARYAGTSQAVKDAEMLSQGATLVGKNAKELAGEVFNSIRTIVVRLP